MVITPETIFIASTAFIVIEWKNFGAYSEKAQNILPKKSCRRYLVSSLSDRQCDRIGWKSAIKKKNIPSLQKSGVSFVKSYIICGK
jgi:hypothetical protein